MKTGKYFSGFLLFILNTGIAQEEFEITNMGGGGFTVGYGYMNIAAIETMLPVSVENLSNDQVLMGGTGHGMMGRLVIGGGGFAITGNRFATDSLRGNLSGGIGTFDVGYVLLNKNKIKIFPMLGIGGGGYGISMTKTGTLSVNNILTEPAREINISQGSIVADVSVNIYTIPTLKYDAVEKAYGGFMIGLKIGYVYSVPNSLWGYAGGDIIGGPRFGLNMPYAKIVIGGFGFNKNL